MYQALVHVDAPIDKRELWIMKALLKINKFFEVTKYNFVRRIGIGIDIIVFVIHDEQLSRCSLMQVCLCRFVNYSHCIISASTLY